MAFFLLLPVLLLGTTAIALSESERDYYYENRYSSQMQLLGRREEDGTEVWQDRRYTGVYYVDDGWDVRRVGTPGFVPHPVDQQHLRLLCEQYNRENLPWVDFMLAMYENRTDQLWESFFTQYQLGPQPKEPTWGRGIRKSRWAKYDSELAIWRAKKLELEPRFRQDLQSWAQKKRQFDADRSTGARFAQASQRASGTALLQRALSGIQPQEQGQQRQQFRATVPANCPPGSTFQVMCVGQPMLVPVPEGAVPGTKVTFWGPPPAAAAAAVVQHAEPVSLQQPPPPPAIVPPTAGALPPALGSASEPPRQSSMRW